MKKIHEIKSFEDLGEAYNSTLPKQNKAKETEAFEAKIDSDAADEKKKTSAAVYIMLVVILLALAYVLYLIYQQSHPTMGNTPGIRPAMIEERFTI